MFHCEIFYKKKGSITMSVIELTRQLGAAIQADERYKAFDEAKKANDADKELNDLIGKINLVQLNYQQEAAKGHEVPCQPGCQVGRYFLQFSVHRHDFRFLGLCFL